jgi:hypothetical protein
MFKFPTTIGINKSTFLALLTSSETESFNNDETLCVEVNVLMKKRDGSTVLTRGNTIPADVFSKPLPRSEYLGKLINETTTYFEVVGLLIGSTASFNFLKHANLSIFPPSAYDRDVSHTFAANFRLRSDYLPCRDGTPASDKWTNGHGIAYVDIATQQVMDIVFSDKGLPMNSSYPNVGEVVESETTDTVVAVTCVMANGGVSFTGLVA